MFRIPLTLALLTAAAFAAPALAETSNCTVITTLPATLGTQGNYCLTGTLSTALAGGNIVTITGDDITLDCNGHSLVGTAVRSSTRAVGIFAQGRSNITVRNCGLRGFQYGLRLLGTGGTGHLVENNAVSGNAYAGIEVQGIGAQVRENRVVDIGGTNVPGFVTGIRLTGAYGRIVHNQVAEIHTITAGVIGIATLGTSPMLERNVVHSLHPLLQNGGLAYGIHVSNGGQFVQAALTWNTVLGDGTEGVPILFVEDGLSSHSYCSRNTMLGFSRRPASEQIDNCYGDGTNYAFPSL